MNFIFNTEYSILLVLILLCISFFASYYTYRGSRINNPAKFLLRTFRFLSIFLILFLLLSPFVKSLKIFNRKPLNIILIDNSSSLNLESRKDTLLNYIRDNIKYFYDGECETAIYTFSGQLSDEIEKKSFDSIKFSGNNNNESDLSSALQSLAGRYKDRRISAVNIFSDGMINSGGNPANTVKIPDAFINYYLIGDTAQKKDITIGNLEFNKYGFIESDIPLKVNFSSYNYNTAVKINLYEDEILRDSRIVNVVEGNTNYTVNFTLSSPVESVKKYKVEIEPRQDEITTKNNYEEFFVKFINNKIKVLVLSGGPSADFAYISQEIRKINNFDVKFLTQKSANEFYEGTADNFDSYQLFILTDFPTQITGTTLLFDLKEKLSRNNAAVIFIAGKSVDYSRLSVIENFLPFKADGMSNSEITSGLSSVLSNDDEQMNFKSLNSISKLPNIFRPGQKIPVKPQAETVLVFSADREPALIISKTNDNRSAAIMFYGIYKWRLNPLSVNSDEILNSMLSGAALSITDKEKGSRFLTETTKQIYSPGEDIVFNSTLNNIELKGNEKVKIRIYNDSFSHDLEPARINPQTFSGKIRINIPGDYNYIAELYSGDEILDKVSNKFMIGENNFEYKQTRANDIILKSLAAASSGKKLNNLSGAEINKYIKEISENMSEKIDYSEKIFLSNNLYYLIIVILLMAAEWFLRKRSNLP